MSNDRLKFRAWDGEKFYIPVFAEGEWYRSAQDCGEGTVTSDPVIQWTGLYDRDGVEIYEGDIVQPQYNDIGAVEAKMYRDLGQYNVGGYNLDKCRIIGNAYESPELVGKVWNRA